MIQKNDPIGQAILDFSKSKQSVDIVVLSDLCEDDVIPSGYLFRSFKEMPNLEKVALNHCKGSVLDIGAGAGCHSVVLHEKGLDITTLETSEGATTYLQSLGIKTLHTSIQQFSDQTFDTLLLLMNGIGLAGKLINLESFLIHLKKLLKPGGIIICDSTDIRYLYEEEDGSMWMDLTSEYYGNFKFQMRYNDHQTDWFDWLYVDFDRLSEAADKTGFTTTLLYEEEDENHYLVKLSVK
ncbi:MAG: class I SAM-dependent methyltransferase [Crocinitomicaceae bacterium]|nr:class I SAM-dependent methyltransferase [Crocinitomicaceae bacterium]